MKDEQKKLLELKESALVEKKKEREKIKKGLRKIDEQEAHVDPRDVLMVRLQSRMLSELTNLDFMRMRYIFTFSGKKGMDRIGFTKFIWEISRFKPINFESDFQLTDEQEVYFFLVPSSSSFSGLNFSLFSSSFRWCLRGLLQRFFSCLTMTATARCT